uniref:Uncharacterized protein n=1 Tax=Arundo donax TaxID=35708 RepID=A0A0A8YHM3_ARUDO
MRCIPHTWVTLVLKPSLCCRDAIYHLCSIVYLYSKCCP